MMVLVLSLSWTIFWSCYSFFALVRPGSLPILAPSTTYRMFYMWNLAPTHTTWKPFRWLEAFMQYQYWIAPLRSSWHCTMPCTLPRGPNTHQQALRVTGWAPSGQILHAVLLRQLRHTSKSKVQIAGVTRTSSLDLVPVCKSILIWFATEVNFPSRNAGSGSTSWKTGWIGLMIAWKHESNNLTSPSSLWVTFFSYPAYQRRQQCRHNAVLDQCGK